MPLRQRASAQVDTIVSLLTQPDLSATEFPMKPLLTALFAAVFALASTTALAQDKKSEPMKEDAKKTEAKKDAPKTEAKTAEAKKTEAKKDESKKKEKKGGC